MIDKVKLSFFGYLLLFFCSISGFSQVKKDTISLSGIILQASPIKNSIQNSASSVAVLGISDIQKTDAVVLTPIFNKIPGVFMQQGAMNTNRIIIRGIGARTPYGTNRIKAYFDGIPITSVNGETVIEDIDVTSLERIEIIKGPNATSFGSGLGGIINLYSKTTTANESFGKYSNTVGSFGLLQQRISSGFNDAKTNFSASYSDLEMDGYRDNSAYKRKNFNLFAKQKIAQKGSLSFLGMYTHQKAYIPSSLNEKEYENNPEKAATTWALAQGYKTYDKLLMGLGYDHQFSEKWSLHSSLFSNFINAYEARPFDILDDKSTSLGLRFNINYKDDLFSIPFELSFGTEMATENYKYQLYKNLYASNPGQGSVQGALFNAANENRNYQNYFLQMEFWLTNKLHLETGIALNTTQYSLKNVFDDTLSQNQTYSFGNIWSPRIGLSYKISDGKNIYTAVSKGFSVPAIAETLTPDGQINTNLKPEIGWNYEIGFKGNWLQNRIYAELVVFSTQIENLLVARRTSDDQYVGINAGSSSHPGIEFMINYKLFQETTFEIAPYISGALNRFVFKNFVDDGADYSGNKLTNVPEKQLNFGLDFYTKFGFTLNASYNYTGKIPMNDANTKYTDSFALLNFKTAYAFTILKNLKTEVNAGVNNALNEKYAASILPNAVGFGGLSPRYYYPGNPVNYYGGIAITYFF